MVKYQEERQEEGSGKGHCCDKRELPVNPGRSRRNNRERREGEDGECRDSGG